MQSFLGQYITPSVKGSRHSPSLTCLAIRTLCAVLEYPRCTGFNPSQGFPTSPNLRGLPARSHRISDSVRCVRPTYYEMCASSRSTVATGIPRCPRGPTQARTAPQGELVWRVCASKRRRARLILSQTHRAAREQFTWNSHSRSLTLASRAIAQFGNRISSVSSPTHHSSLTTI